MAFNTSCSILGTGDSSRDVEREADVIFTAAFIGMVNYQNEKKGGLTWRVDMEPNTDPVSTKMPDREARTKDDRASMKRLNDICSKVNHLVRSYAKKDVGGVSWGLTPSFDRGGMIYAGCTAGIEYSKVDPNYAKVAYKYLTASQKSSQDGERKDEMYIGRGAYCGLVVDDDGNAVSAMSTICTALNEDTIDVGNRWKPNKEAEVRKSQYNNKTDTWGVIGNEELQETLREQGMRFYPSDQDLNSDNDIVGYTHGMIRCIYETERIGQGTAFEMSIGKDTFKLASCAACSSFMMANNVDPSSSHLGRGESWAPYYTSESHNESCYKDHIEGGIGEAIKRCNSKYAEFMHTCLNIGAKVMNNTLSWVSRSHVAALEKLLLKLEGSKKDNTIARDLFLDAMTYHKSDAKRIDETLTYGLDERRFCDGTYDWCQNRQTGTSDHPMIGYIKGTWETFENPFTDKMIEDLHTNPEPLSV
ncbi:hypothetical protein [Pseudoalteromonas luteoviolacea]|uniref:hypothetical protein n=1 Tax=Pseudoalteromonas luteoviolacea TaxID=43657 RepID=UPI001B359660|nr:hypothetical protein [Pseudoalteromonas luteoviolacea]MBQ4837127.1 hypothetical protein [Pseudoalteromonas luteoviolacea]